MTIARLLVAAAAAVALPIALPAHATCPTPEQVRTFLDSWEAKRPAPAIGAVENMGDAYCGQKLLVEQLKKTHGAIVGYKAGLTSKAIQEKFGATAPVRGVLLADMIVKDGSTVSATFGARPVWEADMILVVKDAGINKATTPEEAMRHISGFIPFIELPDLAVGSNVRLDGNQLAAINVASRLGVAGSEVPLADTPETLKALESVEITADDGSGATLAQSTGAAVLGSPLNVVLWLVKNLNEANLPLKKGDLLSVGSFSPLTPPKSGQTVTVRYTGLPGAHAPQVRVRFE